MHRRSGCATLTIECQSLGVAVNEYSIVMGYERNRNVDSLLLLVECSTGPSGMEPVQEYFGRPSLIFPGSL